MKFVLYDGNEISLIESVPATLVPEGEKFEVHGYIGQFYKEGSLILHTETLEDIDLEEQLFVIEDIVAQKY